MHIGLLIGSILLFLSTIAISQPVNRLQEKLVDAEKNADSNAVFQVLNELSNQESRQGNYPLALKYLFKAENFTSDISKKAVLFVETGLVYCKQENTVEAQYYLKKAEKLMLENGLNEVVLPRVFVLKGEIAFQKLRFKAANENALRALVFFQENDNQVDQLLAMDLLTKANYEQNRLRMALQLSKQHLDKAVEQSLPFEEAKAYTSMALVYGKLNNRDSANICIDNAFQISKNNDALSQLVNVYHTLHLLHEMNNEPKKALIYYKRFSSLKDSLTGQNKAREIAQLEAVKEADNQREINELLNEKSLFQESRIEQKELESNIYMIGLTLFVLLGLLAGYSLIKARAANKKLLKLTSEMRESRDKIKQTSNKLKETNRKLVKIQAALISQKDTAERASSAKDVFLSSVTHELRTPLTAILGLSEEMLSEANSAKERDNLEVIKFSGESLLSLVNDILDYNKIQSGRIELEYISFNLKQYADKLVKALKPRARQNNVRLVYQYDAALPQWFIADPTRIGQVINNFLSNAIKFTENGNVQLDFTLVNQTNDQFQLRVSVRDQGIGIPKDKLEHIFERFAQADVNTTRKYGGTGLGLAISKRIVELFGSKIELESELGEGSCFSFLLTLEKGYPVKREQIIDSEIPEEINILLVEDNKINQKLVAKTFANIGIEIDIANNGLEAIEQLKASENEYDVVLMDMHMPKMDGMEATKEIRRMDGYFQNIPIIALSGSTIKEKQELLDMGLNAFMQKPFKRDELIKLVAEQIVKA